MGGLQRDWSEFALLLIDAQPDFRSERVEQDFARFPDRVTRLLRLCRREGLEIVHPRALFGADGSDWMVPYRLRGRIPCVRGTAGAETLPFAVEEPGERVIVKQTFDGFYNRDLLPHLQARGKRFLLTAGLVTSVCVLLTTASASQLGYLTAVVEDCCADEPFAHETTLDRYQFIFERTRVDLIAEQHAEWVAKLAALRDLRDTA